MKSTKLFSKIFFALLIIFLLSVITISVFQYFLSKQTVLVNSFEECIKIPGVTLQTIYPATCTTPDGKSFTQAITTIPSSSKYTCPANGWVDCMPGPSPKPQCSASALAWYKANCPDFKGAAL